MDANRFLTYSLQDPRLTRILAAAISAVDPGKLVRDYLQKVDLPEYDRVSLLAIGKAAEPMTFAAADNLTHFSDALVVTKHASGQTLRPRSGHALNRVTVMEGGHPIPDERSLAAGKAVLDFVSKLSENDLLICLISGGGSALVTVPKEGNTLADIQSQTSKLLANGATINEINSLRRKLDRIKGGGLARATHAKTISLILSDVIGNSLETIASGPTVDSSLEARVKNIIVGDLHVAAQAAQQQALAEGFDSEIFDLQMRREAREIGLRFAKKLKEEKTKRETAFCLIAGGEATVTIKGNGKGGRNQEIALAAVDELSGIKNVLFVSLATDGDDGPTDAAGAVVNGETCQRGKKLGMTASDYLSRNDAYNFFDPLDDLLKPGYTGTNVNDLIFLIGF